MIPCSECDGTVYQALLSGDTDRAYSSRMTQPPLTEEEFAALQSIDGSMSQRRPSMELEIRLRVLGLIHRDGISRLPVRTAAGHALVKAGRTPDA